MIDAFILMDRPQASQLRQSVRPEHKARLGQAADVGEPMISSSLAIDFLGRSAAVAWLQDEPFNPAQQRQSTF